MNIYGLLNSFFVFQVCKGKCGMILKDLEFIHMQPIISKQNFG